MQYKPELDGLRAIAVVSVVLFHASPYGAVSGGFLGVDLFFVLSGYLITGILLNRPSLSGFYFRRFLRLMPALLLMLGAYLCVGSFLWPGHNHARDALVAGLYLSDYAYTFWGVPHFIRHTWSLAVEEQFYLLWPLALPLLSRSKSPALWLTTAYLLGMMWRGSGAFHSYYYRLDTHATGLILGALLAVAPVRLKPWIGYASLAAFGLLIFSANIQLAFVFIPLAELAAAGLILAPPALLRNPPLVWLGKLSYGIYLWHVPVNQAFTYDFPIQATLTLSLSICFAALSYYTVERWARSLRDGVKGRWAVPVRFFRGQPVGG